MDAFNIYKQCCISSLLFFFHNKENLTHKIAQSKPHFDEALHIDFSLMSNGILNCLLYISSHHKVLTGSSEGCL